MILKEQLKYFVYNTTSVGNIHMKLGYMKKSTNVHYITRGRIQIGEKAEGFSERKKTKGDDA